MLFILPPGWCYVGIACAGGPGLVRLVARGARVDVGGGVVAQRAAAGSGIHIVNVSGMAALIGAFREKVLVHLETSLS